MSKVGTSSKTSRWSQLEGMVSMDVSKMSFPITYYEPITLLQRMAEEMEYSELLDAATQTSESSERMLYVAAFAVSAYASNVDRFAKPFDSFLGETYEHANTEKGYRFVAEQVRSEPPTGAVFAEGENWTYWGENVATSKFAIHAIDVKPTGTWFVRLRKVDGGENEELYYWKKVSTRVSGFLTGNPAVDQYGRMEIRNCTTGDVCYMDFKARGWRASSAYQVSGEILDRNGVACWNLHGHWNKNLCAHKTNVTTKNSAGENSTLLLWKAHERPRTGLTEFAKSLNTFAPSLEACLPRTDSRLRPDRLALQQGKYDLATEEKRRIEDHQRTAQRLRQDTGDAWMPLWFGDRKTCEISGEQFWPWKATYWEEKMS